MKKAAHVVIWIFFIVLPFIKSSSTLDPVLLPRFMFISCTLLALLGTLFFSKEHKICRNYIKSVEGDEFRKNDAYCDCRERLDNKKKFGVEKIFD